jgi:hypothetical protein
MQLAWKLLECRPSEPEEQVALDVMRIQVAQCMKDAARMVPIFDRMMASQGVSDPSDEVLILLFTMAPLLGRWKHTVELGDKLALVHNLHDFHHAPMDYQSVPRCSLRAQYSISWHNKMCVCSNLLLIRLCVWDAGCCTRSLMTSARRAT